MKNTNKEYLATVEVPEDQRKNPEVLRIILSKDFTQIDFGYVAEMMYNRGGWIRISPQTFLTVHGSDKRHLLREARDITIAPEQHHFESKEDWKVFTLIFEPIPIKDCVIDIIEEEDPSPNDFNYYGIKLVDVTGTGVLR
jgi:hypothetical protein